MNPRPHSVRRGIYRSSIPLYVCIGIVILFGTLGVTTASQQSQVLPTPTIDPILLTATAIVGAATATEQAKLGPTITPTPTLTSLELESLRLQWKAEMEKATGFTHPIFDYITYETLLSPLTLSALDRFSLTIDVKRTTYKDITYVALVAHGFGDTFYLFKVQNHTPTLLPDLTHEEIVGGYLSLDDFADRNSNGNPDLSIVINWGGSCMDIGLVLLEIQPDGTVIDIPLPQAQVVGFYDLDKDDYPEISASDFVVIPNFSASCSPYAVTHLYKWDGNGYRDISNTLSEAYYPEIEAYWESANQQDGCLLPDYTMYKMLVGYISLHRLNEGWTQLASELYWEKCSPQTLKEQGEAMGQLLEWVGTYLEESKQTP